MGTENRNDSIKSPLKKKKKNQKYNVATVHFIRRITG